MFSTDMKLVNSSLQVKAF